MKQLHKSPAIAIIKGKRSEDTLARNPLLLSVAQFSQPQTAYIENESKITTIPTQAQQKKKKNCEDRLSTKTRTQISQLHNPFLISIYLIKFHSNKTEI
jgi:hypothetical protein